GNGGNVVKTANGLRVLDLVEAGIPDGTPITFENPDPLLMKAVGDVFGGNPNVSGSDINVLVSYLSSMPIGQKFALTAGLMAYSWKWVNDTFVDVPDVDSPIDFPAGDIIQTAIREGFGISIRQDIWNQLDSRNRVALILHEVIYAYNLPQQYKDQSSG